MVSHDWHLSLVSSDEDSDDRQASLPKVSSKKPMKELAASKNPVNILPDYGETTKVKWDSRSFTNSFKDSDSDGSDTEPEPPAPLRHSEKATIAPTSCESLSMNFNSQQF